MSTKAARKALMFSFLERTLDKYDKILKNVLKETWEEEYPDLKDYFTPLMHSCMATGKYQCSKQYYFSKRKGMSNWHYRSKMQRNRRKQDKREVDAYKEGFHILVAYNTISNKMFL